MYSGVLPQLTVGLDAETFTHALDAFRELTAVERDEDTCRSRVSSKMRFITRGFETCF